MKKSAVLFLSAILAASFMIPAHAAEAKALTGTPKIDGKLDDIYTQSGTLKVDTSMYVWDWGGGRDKSKVSSVSYFLHDDEYIYIATVVSDDNTLVDTGIISDWMADAIETWIKFPGAAKNSKISVDAYNTKVYGSDYNDFDKCKSAATQDKTSYTVEVAIPLGDFKTGDSMPVSIQINDCNDKEAKVGSAWGSQKADNTVLLSADKVVVKKAETPKTDTAAQTADAGIIASIAAMAASAAVIFKKKH